MRLGLKSTQIRRKNSVMPGDTVSACIIVGDDRDDKLIRCLDSLKGHVDEIVVVHTGHSRKTRRIIRKYTKKLYLSEWKNDFSTPRNLALTKSTCEWMLYIDSDEYLMHPEKLKQNLDPSQAAYPLRLHHLNERGLIFFRDSCNRLFKKVEGVRFLGKIHEYLVDRDGNVVHGSRVKNKAIIYHTGYANEEKTEKKLVKYHRMILEDIKSRRGEKIIHFFLAREAYNHARTLVKKDGRLTKKSMGLILQSMRANERYRSMEGRDRFGGDAKRLYDLCRTILFFQDSPSVIELITKVAE